VFIDFPHALNVLYYMWYVKALVGLTSWLACGRDPCASKGRDRQVQPVVMRHSVRSRYIVYTTVQVHGLQIDQA
jgi:hypothetical protein